MNNILLLLIVIAVMGFGSCKTSTKQTNAQQDKHAPKRINNTKPVIIPDVDVDEIIRKNPPQYENPNNKIDMDEPKPKSLNNQNKAFGRN